VRRTAMSLHAKLRWRRSLRAGGENRRPDVKEPRCCCCVSGALSCRRRFLESSGVRVERLSGRGHPHLGVDHPGPGEELSCAHEAGRERDGGVARVSALILKRGSPLASASRRLRRAGERRCCRPHLPSGCGRAGGSAVDVGERPLGKRAAHGYEPTREAAMAAFAKSWRRK
jgi:hypothetical protein